MSDMVFKKVDYTLGNLVAHVEQGDIGLPELQRPFVWPVVRVRDLFDSLYRGYPIGYFLLGENGLQDGGADKILDSEKDRRMFVCIRDRNA